MGKLYDRVGMGVSGTPGAGNITLSTTRITDATNGDLLSFAEAGASSGDSVNYLAVDGNKWEVGTADYSSTGPALNSRFPFLSWDGTTVARATFTPISLSSSTKIYCAPASFIYGGLVLNTNNGTRLILSGSNNPSSMDVELGGAVVYTADTTKMKIPDGSYLGFSDVSVRRNAAGIMEISSGTAGTFRDLIARNIRTNATTVASLTAASTAGPGARSFVTDANATTFGTTVAGSGSNAVPVYSDGTNWKIG